MRHHIDHDKTGPPLPLQPPYFRALQQGEFDTSTSMGRLVTGILGVIAEFENDLRRVLAYSMINQVGFMVVGIGIGTDLALNGAGDPFCLEPAELQLTLAAQDLSAYARLLVEALDGNPALAIRGDEAEECCRIVEPIVAEWENGSPPLLCYPAGSEGPAR